MTHMLLVLSNCLIHSKGHVQKYSSVEFNLIIHAFCEKTKNRRHEMSFIKEELKQMFHTLLEHIYF